MVTFKPKSITLQAYNIEHVDIKSACSDLFDRLRERWDKTDSANDRRLSLNKTSSEEDVLAGLTVTSTYAIGIILRISPTNEVPIIPDELFKGKTIELSVQSEDGNKSSVTVLSTFYFLVSKNCLISTLPHSQIKRLQTYLNWWLSFGAEEKNYKFSPMIKVPEDYKLSDMKELVLGEQYLVPTKTPPAKSDRTSTSFRVIDVAADFIRNQVSDVPNLDELIKQHIINAKLLITFSKPRKMTVEDYKTTLSSYLKPIANPEDVHFKLKNGKTVKSNDVLYTKTVSIERLDALRISEPDLFSELKEFMKELSK